MAILSTTFVLTSLVVLLRCIGLAAAINVINSPPPPGMVAKPPTLPDMTPEIDPEPDSEVYPVEDLGDPCTPEELKSKEFDLIVYGASGSMGQAIMEILLQAENNGTKWAVAGRNADTIINAIRGGPNGSDFNNEIIVAPQDDVMKLEEMTKRAKVVINCAGPYENSGTEDLIRAAIKSCTHYVDLSSELVWQGKVLETYHNVSKERGVAIVQSLGSAIADMLAMAAAKDHIQYTDETPEEVLVVWTRMNGRRTYGDLESKKRALLNHGPVLNPYILAPHVRPKMKTDLEMDGFVSMAAESGRLHGFDERLRMMMMPSSFAPWDCAMIRRSMAISFPGQAVHVREANTDRVVEYMKLYELALTQHDPTGLIRLKSPVPDSLPPSWQREAGSSAGFAVAFQTGQYNPVALVKMEQHGDPATVAIPTVAVEVALSLARNGPNTGGYLTPITATPDLENQLRIKSSGNFFTTYHKRYPFFPIEH